MRAILLATAVVATLAMGGNAAAQAVTNDAAKVRAGVYKVEPLHTRIVFSLVHMGFSTWYGDFTGASGTLKFDSKAPAHSVLEISVPTASVTTTNAKLDGELKAADWLDAAQFPQISFRSTSITLTGPVDGTITGDLTLHGVTQPVALTAHFNGAGINPLDHEYTIGFDAKGQISRSAFGVAKYVPLVGDTVTLLLSGAFERGH